MTQKSLVEDLLSDNGIVKTFYPQKILSPLIFNNNNEFNPIVRKKLLKISDEFMDFLGVEFFIHDIVLTGSLASYGWSKYSDIDLHIIIDYDEIDHNNELLNQFFDAKKDSWNNLHDIKIRNFEVEIYVQDIKEEHVSSGVFSILNNEWVVKPKPTEINIDEKKIISKSNEYIRHINSLCKKFKNGNDITNESKKLKDKLKNFRKIGLSNEGEYSYENLVFKYLRRNGYIKKLIDLKTKNFDKKLSINEQQLNY